MAINMAVMTASKLVEKAKEIEKSPTQYVYGTYGQKKKAEHATAKRRYFNGTE